MYAAPETALPRSKNNYNARRRLTRTGDERATDDGETDSFNVLNNNNFNNLRSSEHHAAAAAAAKHAKRHSSGVRDSHIAAKRSSGSGTTSEHTAEQHMVADSHRAKRQSAPASNGYVHNGHESNRHDSNADAMQQHRLAAQSLIANLQHEHIDGDTSSSSDALQAERSLRAHTYSNGSAATANTNTGMFTVMFIHDFCSITLLQST
jgi:hypothetical protein